MGVPWETKEDFIAGSPVTHAKNLQGDLLLVHGTGDDNVHYQNSEQMINELIKFNKVFQLMSYPNRSHGIWEGQNTTRHVYTTLTSFLNEHIEPGAKERNQHKIEIKFSANLFLYSTHFEPEFPKKLPVLFLFCFEMKTILVSLIT
jgi:hypothetical protein